MLTEPLLTWLFELELTCDDSLACIFSCLRTSIDRLVNFPFFILRLWMLENSLSSKVSDIVSSIRSPSFSYCDVWLEENFFIPIPCCSWSSDCFRIGKNSSGQSSLVGTLFVRNACFWSYSNFAVSPSSKWFRHLFIKSSMVMLKLINFSLDGGF
jgi:hypothetical protein